jgi:hypothetical protein
MASVRQGLLTRHPHKYSRHFQILQEIDTSSLEPIKPLAVLKKRINRVVPCSKSSEGDSQLLVQMLFGTSIVACVELIVAMCLANGFRKEDKGRNKGMAAARVEDKAEMVEIRREMDAARARPDQLHALQPFPVEILHSRPSLLLY